MTIEKILDQIYSFEDVLATFPRREDAVLVPYLTRLTRLIAQFDIVEEINNTDVKNMSDEQLQRFSGSLYAKERASIQELLNRCLGEIEQLKQNEMF